MHLVRASAVAIVAQMPAAWAQTQVTPPEPARDAAQPGATACPPPPCRLRPAQACMGPVWHDYFLWVREHAQGVNPAP